MVTKTKHFLKDFQTGRSTLH